MKSQIKRWLVRDQKNLTRSFLFIFGTLVIYLSTAIVAILPPSLVNIYITIFLVFWLGYPIALYYDKKYVVSSSDWNPSRFYYLGILPSYLGIGLISVYIQKRRKRL